MKLATGLVLLASILITAAGAAYAEPAAPPPPESLEEAWAAALAANQDVLASGENLNSAKEQVAVAKALRMPQVTLNSGYSVLDHAPKIESQANTTFGGMPATVPFEYKIGSKDIFRYGIGAALPLYNGGQTMAAIDAAKARAVAAEFDQSTQVSNTRMAVAEAYLNVLRAQRGEQVARAYVANLEQHHKDVSGAHRQGLIARNDLLTGNVMLADARQQLLQIENQRHMANAAYNQLLGRSLEHPVVLAEISLDPTPESPLVDWLDKAVRKRPELTALQQQIASTAAQAKGAGGATLPKLGLTTGYQHFDNDSMDQEGFFATSIDMSWVLYDGGGARHLQRALVYRQAELLKRRDGLLELIGLQVRRYWLMQQETRQRMGVTEGAIAQAQENLSVTRNNYKEGLMRNTEVLDAETLYLKTQTNHVNAVYDAALAAMQLRWAAGEL